MSFVHATLSQQFTGPTLSVAVRAALGKPLRRATAQTQLALVGALACLPDSHRQLPTALLWQTTHGPREETIALLEEVCLGSAEPMPYDFLATQPTIAAAQIQPWLPGLQSATIFQLDTKGTAQWSLLLALATQWLAQGRYAQILCAHLVSTQDMHTGHWITLGSEHLEKSTVRLQIGCSANSRAITDTPDFPVHLQRWFAEPAGSKLTLQSPAMPALAVEFARP